MLYYIASRGGFAATCLHFYIFLVIVTVYLISGENGHHHHTSSGFVCAGKLGDALTFRKKDDNHEHCPPALALRSCETERVYLSEHLDTSVRRGTEKQGLIYELEAIVEARDAEIKDLRGQLRERIEWCETLLKQLKTSKQQVQYAYTHPAAVHADGERTPRTPPWFPGSIPAPLHPQRREPQQQGYPVTAVPVSGPPPNVPLPPVPGAAQVSQARQQQRQQSMYRLQTPVQAMPSPQRPPPLPQQRPPIIPEPPRQPISSESPIFQLLRTHKSLNDVRQRGQQLGGRGGGSNHVRFDSTRGV